MAFEGYPTLPEEPHTISHYPFMAGFESVLLEQSCVADDQFGAMHGMHDDVNSYLNGEAAAREALGINDNEKVVYTDPHGIEPPVSQDAVVFAAEMEQQLLSTGGLSE